MNISLQNVDKVSAVLTICFKNCHRNCFSIF